MSTHDPSSTREMKVAHAALLALRAGLAEEGEPAPNRFVFEPGAEPIASDAAAALLARRAKPLRCMAVLRDRHVQVDCEPFEPSTRAQRAAWLVETARQNVAFMRETYAIAGAEEKLLLRGVDESVRLSVDDYERWVSDYECASASHAVHPADEKTRAQGVTAVMKFFPAGWSFTSTNRSEAEGFHPVLFMSRHRCSLRVAVSVLVMSAGPFSGAATL